MKIFCLTILFILLQKVSCQHMVIIDGNKKQTKNRIVGPKSKNNIYFFRLKFHEESQNDYYFETDTEYICTSKYIWFLNILIDKVI